MDNPRRSHNNRHIYYDRVNDIIKIYTKHKFFSPFFIALCLNQQRHRKKQQNRVIKSKSKQENLLNHRSFILRRKGLLQSIKFSQSYKIYQKINIKKRGRNKKSLIL